MTGLVGSAVYRCAREGATFSEMGTEAGILSGLLWGRLLTSPCRPSCFDPLGVRPCSSLCHCLPLCRRLCRRTLCHDRACGISFQPCVSSFPPFALLCRDLDCHPLPCSSLPRLSMRRRLRWNGNLNGNRHWRRSGRGILNRSRGRRRSAFLGERCQSESQRNGQC